MGIPKEHTSPAGFHTLNIPDMAALMAFLSSGSSKYSSAFSILSCGYPDLGLKPPLAMISYTLGSLFLADDRADLFLL
jgi:hypothetical protein